MDSKLIKAQDVFLERVNQICSKFGLNNIMAQLYAVLYLSHNPLSLNDMVERLKISKGSASINIRALERYGAVKKVWVKGSRRDHYKAEGDISKVIIDRLKSIAQCRLLEIESMIDASSQALNSIDASGIEEQEAIKLFKQRIGTLKDFQAKARSLFKLFNSDFFGNLLRVKAKNNSKKETLVIK